MTQQKMEERLKERDALKERVKLGNEKLNKAWEEILKMDHDSQRWKDEFQLWHEANEKLSILCMNLKGMGWNDCLYKDEATGKRTMSCLSQPYVIGCRVCSSDIPYWEKEFLGLGYGHEGEGDD